MKGGCIEGLDWSNVKHIWCKRASKYPHPSDFFSLGVCGWAGEKAEDMNEGRGGLGFGVG